MSIDIAAFKTHGVTILPSRSLEFEIHHPSDCIRPCEVEQVLDASFQAAQKDYNLVARMDPGFYAIRVDMHANPPKLDFIRLEPK